MGTHRGLSGLLGHCGTVSKFACCKNLARLVPGSSLYCEQRGCLLWLRRTECLLQGEGALAKMGSVHKSDRCAALACKHGVASTGDSLLGRALPVMLGVGS